MDKRLTDTEVTNFAQTLWVRVEQTLMAELMRAFPEAAHDELEQLLHGDPDRIKETKRAAMRVASSLAHAEFVPVSPQLRRPAGGRIEGDRFINRNGTTGQVFGSWLNEGAA